MSSKESNEGKKSKYNFLIDARQGGSEKMEEAAGEAPPLPRHEDHAPSAAVEVVVPEPAQAKAKSKSRVSTAEPVRPVGRPTGKRSDGEHVQVTAYIRKETHRRTKMALLEEQKHRDFSELVQELLTKWLKSPS